MRITEASFFLHWAAFIKSYGSQTTKEQLRSSDFCLVLLVFSWVLIFLSENQTTYGQKIFRGRFFERKPLKKKKKLSSAISRWKTRKKLFARQFKIQLALIIDRTQINEPKNHLKCANLRRWIFYKIGPPSNTLSKHPAQFFHPNQQSRLLHNTIESRSVTQPQHPLMRNF